MNTRPVHSNIKAISAPAINSPFFSHLQFAIFISKFDQFCELNLKAFQIFLFYLHNNTLFLKLVDQKTIKKEKLRVIAVHFLSNILCD